MPDRELARGQDGVPSAATPGRRRNMQAIRRTDTKPEVALRAALHRLGLRFRKDFRIDLPAGRVRPDIVFTRARVAVFVDGCFWHACPEHGRQPTKNVGYWSPKLQRTADRDRLNTARLEANGWKVIRAWEHEPLADVVGRVHTAVRAARLLPFDNRTDTNPRTARQADTSSQVVAGAVSLELATSAYIRNKLDSY